MTELQATISPESATALREMVRQLDAGDVQYDGYGAAVRPHQVGN